MKHSVRASALATKYEQFRANPYLCPAGYWTIGKGAIWDLQGNRVTPATPPVTPEEAEWMFDRDLGIADRAMARLLAVPLTQNQWDAICSWTFNLGSGRLQSSTLRQIIRRGEHEDVPGELMKWVWAGGRRVAGLVRRRQEEAHLYVTG